MNAESKLRHELKDVAFVAVEKKVVEKKPKVIKLKKVKRPKKFIIEPVKIIDWDKVRRFARSYT